MIPLSMQKQNLGICGENHESLRTLCVTPLPSWRAMLKLSSSWIRFFMLFYCQTVAMGLGRLPLLREEIQEPKEQREADDLGLLLILALMMRTMKTDSHTVQITSAKKETSRNNNHGDDANSDN